MAKNMLVPNDAVFVEEEEGVQWFKVIDHKGRTTNNFMVFDNGRVLSGNWGLPRFILRILAGMTSEERTACKDHDEFMGEIHRRIVAWKDGK